MSEAQFVRVIGRQGALLRFTIDGRPAAAQAGDTLLTALLLNGRVARRYEFADTHRAGYCLMGACQDCWVRLADGRRLRACTTPLEEGMAVVVEGSGRG